VQLRADFNIRRTARSTADSVREHLNLVHRTYGSTKGKKEEIGAADRTNRETLDKRL
jgi:hypothetical protein